MISALFKIRLKQIQRAILEIGFLRIILLILLFGFAVIYMYVLSSKLQNSVYVTSFMIFVVVLIQTRRQDKKFSRIHFKHFRLTFFIEYIFLSIPLFICLAIHSHLIVIYVLFFLLFGITWINIKPKNQNLNTAIQKWIPENCFEWKAGIRKTLFWIVPLWIIGFATSFYIGSVPITIFILGITFLSFYENGEPYQMILSFELSSNQFLLLKLKAQVAIFSIVVLPLVALFIIFHPELWYIPVAEYLVFISLLSYTILVKYAYYEPNSRSAAAQTFVAIGALGAIIPVFLPIVWLMSGRFYFKSVDKLNFYLNDYN